MTAAKPSQTDPRPGRRWVHRIPEAGVVGVIAFAFAWQYGFSFATSNQAGYILGALRMIDPGVLAHDWLTMNGKLFPAFQYVAWALISMDKDGWGMGIANFLSIFAGVLMMYMLVRSVVSTRIALVAFAMIMAVDAITRTHSVAISYLFEGVLQPSSFGTLGWLAGCVLFLRARWLASGIALALGGILHPNFLVLGLPTFGLAHLLLGSKGLAGRALRQFAPSLVMLGFVLPALLDMRSGDVELAQTILFRIRSPHHYFPLAFHADFGPFLAWQMLGLGVGGMFLRRWPPVRRRTTALILPHLAMVWLGTLFTTVFYVPQVVQLFIWRLAPFCDLWMQIIGFGALARFCLHPRAWHRVSSTAVAATAFGLCFLLVDASLKNNTALTHTLLGIVVCVVVLSLIPRLPMPARLGAIARRARFLVPTRPLLVTVVFLVVWLLAAKDPVRDYRGQSTLLSGFAADEVQMYDWIRANTSKDAVFVTPPDLERFRVMAHRATVVDWKSHPYDPVGVVEWFERLVAVTGKMEIRNKFDAESAYNGIDAARVERLKQRYGIEYAVVPSRTRQSSLQRYPKVYSNQTYSVLDVTP
jgi:hypothetical protein